MKFSEGMDSLAGLMKAIHSARSPREGKQGIVGCTLNDYWGFMMTIRSAARMY